MSFCFLALFWVCFGPIQPHRSALDYFLSISSGLPFPGSSLIFLSIYILVLESMCLDIGIFRRQLNPLSLGLSHEDLFAILDIDDLLV